MRPLLVLLGLAAIEFVVFYGGVLVGRAGRRRHIENVTLIHGSLVRAAKEAVASYGEPHHALAIHNLDSEVDNLRMLEK